jgi:hypothetical protein
MTVITSPAGLDGAQQNQLERLVIRSRALLEDDLRAQAEGRFGIHADGTLEDEAALRDDPSDRTTGRDLVEIVTHLRSLGESPAGAVARLLREAAFTHLNRLLAIRIAEAIGLLPESLSNGRQSRGFKDLGEIMPILSDDYWGYLLLCGDELAADAPALFDPRNPLLALAPSTRALDELVALLGNSDAAPLWMAPDALGWAYQFFNTGDERRQMREAAAGPRTSRELAVRNQFFTPRYVVDFLVQNTLGRRLVESEPTSPLLGELPLLVDTPLAQAPPLDLTDVAVLDPACGSGHFLLGCYDLLERAWDFRGVGPSEAAPAIVSALWGVDIDPRCAQVASAAIVLRARRHCRDRTLPRPNVVTARSLPGDAAAVSLDIALTPEQRSIIDRITQELASAPVLGTLLKVEDALEQEIRHAAFGGAAGTLPLTDDAFGRAEADLIAHLQAIADQASSSVAERLLAAEAQDALRLVEVVRKRYHAVLMNPPFGEPVPETRPYLRASYPELPGNSDLFAAFVDRGVELCRPDGYLGAITSRAGFFLTTFAKWRRELLDGRGQLVCAADLGAGVMQQAMVEAAAYVIRPSLSDANDASTAFFRLLDEADKGPALASAISTGANRFDVRVGELLAMPGSALSYWMPAGIHALLRSHPPLEGNKGTIRLGPHPGEDFRFLRLWWEVSAKDLADRRWVSYAKGGEYSPGLSDPHLVVAWDEERGTFRGFYGRPGRPSHKPESVEHFFKPGLTWPRRTQGGFNPRALPAGCVFADKGPGIVEIGDERAVMALLGWMLSRPFLACLESAVSFGSYEVGIVQRMPAYPNSHELADLLAKSAREMVNLQATRAATDEVDLRFEGPATLAMPDAGSIANAVRRAHLDRASSNVRVHVATAAAEVALRRTLGLSDRDLAFLDAETGLLLGSLPESDSGPPDDFPRALAESLTTPQTRASQLGPSVEPSFDSLCVRYEKHPATILSWIEETAPAVDLPVAQEAKLLFSYLVGAAFGRWDVRKVGSETRRRGPTEALPPCSPAMLVAPDGFPAARPPVDYPLDIPPTRVLIDELGTRWDIEAAVLQAASAVVPQAGAIMGEILEILGRRTVREHLRRQFFKDHLSQYSKSRRKSPIYWPLTVPSKSWGVWVYAPMLSRETLYLVASEAARRERLADEAIARLQREQQHGGADRSGRTVAEELDTEEKLAEELRLFRAEAERVAGLGWEPDLDDGLVLCAAPLADLFPAWSDAKKARDELRKGQYEWAAVAQWAGSL